MRESANKGFRVVGCAAVVVAVIAVALWALSALFVPRNNTFDDGIIDERAHGILGEPADTIDVVFVGDSESINAYSPLPMWEERGFTSYVCATVAQTLPYGFTMLRRATQDQSPRLVVIEANSAYAPFSLDDAAFRTLQDLIPALEYHNRWKRVSLSDVTTEPQTTWTDAYKGYYVTTDVLAADDSAYMAPSDEVRELPLLNRLYLQAMIDYCREVGAVPVLMSTPSTLSWDSASHYGMAEFAAAAGVDFIDLNVEPTKVAVDWQADTNDGGEHMNLSGGTKVSAFVGPYLSDRYGLPDHRGDEAYRSWDEALERYNTEVKSLLGDESSKE